LYEKALPALRDALHRHLRDTNPLTDAPSVRLCRFACLELEDMIDFGSRCIECLVDDASYAAMSGWLARLDQCLTAAGRLDGTATPAEAPPRLHSATPYVYAAVPRRDERFQDLYNQ